MNSSRIARAVLSLMALVCGIAVAALPDADRKAVATFPAWSSAMKVWPFDLLYPDTNESEIRANLDHAVHAGANTVIFFIEEEQMYRTFVDEDGWSSILEKIG